MAAETVSPDIRHLLERISYGSTRASLKRARTMGAQAYLEQQLHPEEIDDGLLETLLAANLPTLSYSAAQALALLGQPGGGAQLIAELRVAKLARAALSERQLLEVMVGFWTDHFSIYQNDGPLRALKTVDEREVIRPHALGYFRDLLHASAKSPAMLLYLDNETNRVDGLNENYGRELLELHTLGVDGGYAETDVVETARCLSGWSVSRDTGEFLFRPYWHDRGAKQVMEFQIPAGGGIEDGERLLDYLATHPSTAAFISRKLCIALVTDDPDPSLVETATTTFLASGGNIREILRSIFAHPAFLAAQGTKFKRPQRLLASALRLLSGFPDENGLRFAHGNLDAMGHAPYSWPAPNGYPAVGGYWLNGNAMLQRWNLIASMTLTGQSFWGVDWQRWQVADETAESLTTRVAEELAYPLQEAQRHDIVQALQSLVGTEVLTPLLAEVVARHIVYLMLTAPGFQSH